MGKREITCEEVKEEEEAVIVVVALTDSALQIIVPDLFFLLRVDYSNQSYSAY